MIASPRCSTCDGRGWYYTKGASSYGRERCACGAPLSAVGRAQVGATPPAPAQLDLDALEAAMRDATPGPWGYDERVAPDWADGIVRGVPAAYPKGAIVAEAVRADARAIVAAVNAVPGLVAELRRLRAVVAQGVPRG